MSEDKLTLRTLRTGAAGTLVVTATVAASGHSGAAIGFLIGAVLSLFSLFSLTFLVPLLLRPEAPKFAGSLLGVTLFMKLPLYFAGLYAATHIPGVSAVWTACGIALAPMIITLKTIGGILPKPLRVSDPSRTHLDAATRAMGDEAVSLTRQVETISATVFHPQAHVATASERG